MKTKVDKSLEEVWEMKSLAHENFVNSKFSNYLDYINSRQNDLNIKFNLRKIEDLEQNKLELA